MKTLLFVAVVLLGSILHLGAQPSTTASIADLGLTPGELEERFGAPSDVRLGLTKPASFQMLFKVGDLNYEVSFWHGVASHINVMRRDFEALKGEDIQAGLKAFSGGETWNSETDKWTRKDASAWIVKIPPVSGMRLPANVLRITTQEFWKEHKLAGE